MSLVVAAVHDDNRIALVADTKVTYPGDEARTRRTYAEALPKIVLLRSDLAVGVTGDDPHRVIEGLIAHREASASDILEHLVSLTSAGFVVAALNPAKLWTVQEGQVDERTSIRRAWAGDRCAYECFQEKALEWSEDTEIPFRLLSSMQWLTSFNIVASVGGYALRVAGDAGGFSFVPDVTMVGPWILEVAPPVTSQTAVASVPQGGDSTTHRVLLHPGRDATPGALGLLVPEAGVGLLFTHERPWEGVRIVSSTASEFVEAAYEDHQQILLEPRPAFPFG